jgi:hypothetical protein
LLSELRAKAAELVEAREFDALNAPEELDELSRATLGSYIKKAAQSATDKAVQATDNLANKRYYTGRAQAAA